MTITCKVKELVLEIGFKTNKSTLNDLLLIINHTELGPNSK